MKRYLIIGNGIAGLTAVKAIRNLDLDGKVTVVSTEDYPAYSRVLLTHYIAGHAEEDDLFLIKRSGYDELGVSVVWGIPAQGVDASSNSVQLRDGRRLAYDSLLIATGARPRFRGSVGANDYTNAIGLRTIDDARTIREVAVQGGSIVVTGGGLVGVKLVSALGEAGFVPPHLLVRSPHLLSQVADDEAAGMVANQLASKGVRLHLATHIEEVISESGRASGSRASRADLPSRRITRLRLSTGEQLNCDLLVMCKGVTPATECTSGQVEQDWGIVVDEKMRTNKPDIFAVGDVAATRDLISGERRVSAIWPHAVSQARVAGINMAGGEAAFSGALSRNAMDVMGLPFISMGQVRVPADSSYEVLVERKPDSYRKLVLRDRHLVGAVLVGNVAEAGRLQALIRKGEPLS